jgi:hypothetical protein
VVMWRGHSCPRNACSLDRRPWNSFIERVPMGRRGIWQCTVWLSRCAVILA